MRETKMGILGNMKAGFLKALAKAAAIISMTGKQVGVDASAVAQVLTSQIEQQPYIYVGRGKGGKKQYQRILPHDMEFIKQYFDAVNENEHVFDRKYFENDYWS